METINNLANSAAKAVWGESNTTATTANDGTVHPGTETTNNETKGTEPVSGKLGDTSKGEPFDAGNIAGGLPTEADNPPTASLAGITVEDTEPKAPTTEHHSSTTSDVNVNQSGGPTTEHPSTTGDHGGFKAAQADVRDPEDSLTTDPKTETARKNVDDTGALDKSENPDKVDGPGPKPIDEVAHERGGDAGNTARESASGAGAGEGPGAASHSEGTGEKYVKSSGLAADGGDFDATKPGAGREADRLLEQKGYTNPAVATAGAHKDEEADLVAAEKESTDKASTGSHDSKEKKHSLKDKIKAKLHKS
ncbi:hypothetical protein SLS53_004727 [Cytospora paraplurivora]|uniref:Glycine-rich cell wall structural protein 1 n=1 Tax=Cytospora paraplurivora TaxID=2898453 RepID=A0AAN9U9V1_9PEZI